MLKPLIKIIGMLIVGLSVVAVPQIGLWFLLPWVAGWVIYDTNTLVNK